MIQRCFYFLICLLTFFIISIVSLKHTSGDFDVYYYTSQQYIAKAPIYIAHGGINEFKYSPLFVLLFFPLTLFTKNVSIYIWSIFNIFYFYAIFYIFYKLNQFSFKSLKDLMIVVLLFALTGRYIIADYKLGQVNMLLCFLMVLTMYFEINKKDFWAGTLLAFSLMIKFFPLLFVAYFLLRRRFKLLGFTAIMIIVFLFLPSVYSGFSLNLKYLHDWFALLKSTPPVILYSFRNNSLLAYFSWIFIVQHQISNIFGYLLIKKGLSTQVYLAWGLSCFTLFVLFFRDTFFVKDKDPQIVYLDYSCLFVCGLLFNPLAYLNALTFLIVPCFYILHYLFYSQVSKKYLITISLMMMASFILLILGTRLSFRNDNQFYAFLAVKPLMWVIVLSYLSLLIAKFSLKLKSQNIDGKHPC